MNRKQMINHIDKWIINFYGYNKDNKEIREKILKLIDLCNNDTETIFHAYDKNGNIKYDEFDFQIIPNKKLY